MNTRNYNVKKFRFQTNLEKKTNEVFNIMVIQDRIGVFCVSEKVVL